MNNILIGVGIPVLIALAIMFFELLPKRELGIEVDE